MEERPENESCVEEEKKENQKEEKNETPDVVSMSYLPASAVPFGYIRCTFEKYPKVLYLNEQMKKALAIADGSDADAEFVRDNIFFAIPFEEIEQFRRYLDIAAHSREPIRIRHRIRKADGECTWAEGWMGTVSDQKGERNYTIVYTGFGISASKDISVNSAYFKALESAYNVIFEIDLALKTVECIYGKQTSSIGKFFGIKMTIDSAIDFWVNNFIVESDRKSMRDYFRMLQYPESNHLKEQPMQTEFLLEWEDKKLHPYIGVAIQMDVSCILFCCRDTGKTQFSGFQARKTHALKKLHTVLDKYYMNLKHSSGAMILERLTDEHIEIIYAGTDVQQFLNLSEGQYLKYMEDGLTISELADLAEAHGVSGLRQIFEGGEAFYTDELSGETMKISCELLTEDCYEITAVSDSVPGVAAGIPQRGIYVRTFGFFDIFVDGSPVVFSNNKEKEFLALLVDRQGGTITSQEAVGLLWEDEIPDEKLKTRFRKLALGLKRTLERYGIDHILVNQNGVRSVDTTAFVCDYYELLAGNTPYVQSFHNSYMSNYEWAERTLGSLWDYS